MFPFDAALERKMPSKAVQTGQRKAARGQFLSLFTAARPVKRFTVYAAYCPGGTAAYTRRARQPGFRTRCPLRFRQSNTLFAGAAHIYCPVPSGTFGRVRPMPDKSWTLLSSRTVLEHRIFRLDEDLYRLETSGAERDFARLVCPDWVNVVPLTADRQVVLIRQYRHGVRGVTLEVPGGIIDPGEDPQVAAERELQEETGYTAERIVALGSVSPNPALISNSCYFYLAENCRLTTDQEPDPFERIEVVTAPIEEIPDLVRSGQIRHGLVLNALAMVGIPLTTI